MSIPRWLVVIVLVLFVLGMIAWARGIRHHRGNEVDDALGATYAVSQPISR